MADSRRRFLQRSILAGGALAAGSLEYNAGAAAPRSAADVITLGPDKVRLSRLAIGTGTNSGSLQRELGIQGLADMLQFGFDNGVVFWDSSDTYRTHPHLKEGLKRIPREKVTILTKSRSRTVTAMKADLDRFRQEIGTDYLDIVLSHAATRENWPSERAGAMEALAEARQQGIVKTYGASIHSLDALKTASQDPWIRVILARFNPAEIRMDAAPDEVAKVLRQAKANGKGVIGMKILGEGQLWDRVDECLEFVLSHDCVDCFTIGAANIKELNELIQKIPAASQIRLPV